TLNDEASAISHAFEIAEATFPLGYSKSVVLVSDGLETEGNSLDTARRLAEKGTRIHTLPSPQPDHPETLVRSIQAPRRVHQHEPVRIPAEVISNRSCKGTLIFYRNGIKIGAREVELKSGLNRFDLTHSAGTDRLAEFSAEIKTPEDTIVDNNSASTIVQ